MKRVLLTGAGGFIGRHCVSLLRQRGYDVHAITRSARSDLDGARWHRADLLRDGTAEALVAEIQPTHLLHLAWYTEHGQFWSSPANRAWVRASCSLLEAFAEVGTRAVSAGTCAEYDWSQGVCDERTTPCRPNSLYGESKLRTQVFQTRHLAARGVSNAWGRVFFPYGPGEPPAKLVASVIRSLLRGEEALCSDGAPVRDFIYVADVAAAFVQLLDGAVEGPVNIGSGVEVRQGDVVRAIGRMLNREDLLRLGALPPRPGDPPRILAVTTRLVSEVGWQPRFDLDAGLRESIAWWRKRDTEAGP
jgi:nucleoside-diphosphate-sugar epimerase